MAEHREQRVARRVRDAEHVRGRDQLAAVPVSARTDRRSGGRRRARSGRRRPRPRATARSSGASDVATAAARRAAAAPCGSFAAAERLTGAAGLAGRAGARGPRTGGCRPARGARAPLLAPFASAAHRLCIASHGSGEQSPEAGRASGPPGLVELRVDPPRRLRRARRGRPRAPPGVAASTRSAEPKWRSSARRRAGPDALDLVEHRLARGRVAARAVERDREAVRLVADPLEELQPGRVRRRARPGRGRPGRNTSSTRFASAITATRGRSNALHRRERRRELALAAVDHDEVRRRRERLVPVVRRGAGREPREAPRRRPRAIAAKSSWPSCPRTANLR